MTGGTAFTFRGIPINATEEERATFASMNDSMQDGWGGTLDQLAEFLSKGYKQQLWRRRALELRFYSPRYARRTSSMFATSRESPSMFTRPSVRT